MYNKASEGYKTFDIIMNNISMYFVNLTTYFVPFTNV